MSELEDLSKEFHSALKSVSTPEGLDQLRSQHLGKKSKLNAMFGLLPKMGEEEKKSFGQKINVLRTEMTQAIDELATKLETAKLEQYVEGLRVDYSLPGYRKRPIGKKHPLHLAAMDIVSSLAKLGFLHVESPQLENDFYNFEALNIGHYHPARDSQDSFYVDATHLLRTHVTAMDAHYIEKQEPPFAVCCYGRTYRRDAVDATHFPVFHQVDALYVDKGLNFGHLKDLVFEMCYMLFDKNVEIRFRPDYFPFTEPSCEISIRPKKGEGRWLEILGCGMFHPAIFDRFGVDSKTYQGIAFGMGVERIAMLRYGVTDIRAFFDNDYEFLGQF